MARNKKRNFKCPSCSQVKEEYEISKTVNIIKLLRQKRVITYYINVDNNLFDQTPLDEFEWACNEYLGRGKAELTNPSKQKYVDYRPYLAYFDSIRECENCKEKYIFRKEEKRFWYEDLNFWVQSKPKHCLKCRKEARIYNKLSKLLSNGKDNLTNTELIQVIEIYEKLERIEKLKYFQAILKKRNK